MKSSCPYTSKSANVEASVPPPEPDQKMIPEDAYEEKADSSQGDVDRDDSYRIEVTRGTKKSYITYENEVLEVTPPEKSEKMTDEFKQLRVKCTTKRCSWIPLWAAGLLNVNYMNDHLCNHHEAFQLLQC